MVISTESYLEAWEISESTEVGTIRDERKQGKEGKEGRGKGCLREYIHTRMAVHEYEKELKGR